MKVSLWAWVLALCCYCFSSPAFANYNNYDWGNDVTYYKDDILSNYYVGGTLTDWQWFPGTGENDGDYSNDQFCQIYDIDGQKTLVYGTNGAQSCSWWADGPYQNDKLVFVDYYSEMMGTVQIDCSNPLNDASCPGYAEAYTNLMCSTNPLYDQSCAGYAEAYFSAQCTANPLHDQSCTGYAEAYLNEQCSIDALYDASCSGYQEAYALQMLEAEPETGAPANDGSDFADDGVPENDGSDIDMFIEPQITQDIQNENIGVTEPSIVEDTGNALNNDEEYAQQQATPEPTIVETQEAQVVVEEPTIVETEEKQIAEAEALEEANSLDLESMSAREVVGALQSLGILGNSQTNGVGDPTGMSGGLPGTGGAISATGQVTVPGLTPTENNGSSQSSNVSSQSSDSLASGGSYTPSGSIAQTGTAGNTLTLNETQDPSGSFDMSMPGADLNQGAGFGTVNSQPEVGVNGITDLENQMGINVNPLFNDPALSSGVSEMASIQEERYETQLQRIIRDRIRNMVEETKLQEDTSNKDAEELVAESIQESIENKMDELQINADQNQSEIVALMGVNILFNDYAKNELPDTLLSDNKDWYRDVEVPQNRTALRNGLAQQILHNQMVDMQYNSEKVDINNYYKEKEDE